MSIEIMSAAWSRSKHEGSHLLVLLALADFANENGECWPSIETIAKKARVSPRHANRILSDLVQSGEVLIIESGGGHRTNTYKINTPDKMSPLTPVSSQPCRPCQGSPDAHVTRSVIDPSINHNAEENTPDIIGSDEPMGAEAPAPMKKRGRKPIEASPESSDFIAWFLDLMEKTGAVRPTLTETDRRAWAAEYDRLVRLDKFTDSQIRAACSFARKDAFYSTWFWRPTFLRVKKEGVLTIQKILARMKQQGWTDPEKQLNIYVEPPDWKERAGRAYPGYDMSDRNWADLPADFRMKILATK